MNAPRFPKKIYLTADAWRALEMLSTSLQDADSILERAIWDHVVPQYPDLVECIAAQNEAVRKFREAQKGS